jgi:hypothetical protein
MQTVEYKLSQIEIFGTSVSSVRAGDDEGMEDSSNSRSMFDVELRLCIFWILRAYNEQQNIINVLSTSEKRKYVICTLSYRLVSRCHCVDIAYF